MGQSSSRQSSIAAVKQTFGMSWQWQKKSISTLSRHTCDGDDDALREQLKRGLEILESDELKHGYRVTSGPQLSQKKRSPLSKSICLLRLTTLS